MFLLNKALQLFLFLIFFALSLELYAYPEFIGHGYSSCMVCHYNGAGGGPLTDYGRSLYASEIAAHKNLDQSEEEMMDTIAFLGKAPQGKFRPYAKFRELWLSNGIGTKSKSWYQIHMQQTVGMTVLFDEMEKWIFSGEIGVVPVPMGANTARSEETKTLISREHYLRYQYADSSWLYFGFLDKPFGIRTPDHTAYSKSKTGFGQSDQTYGVLWQRVREKWEHFLFVYFGNFNQQADVRTYGVSAMSEYEPREKLRLGISGAASQNTYVTQARGALHGKLGLPNGHALLMEAGLKMDKPKTNVDSTYGAYAYFSGMMKASDGFFATSQGEYLKDSLTAGSPEYLRWGLGIAYFPIQRIEMRSQIVQTRTMSESNIGVDAISWQGQLHLSF